MEKIMNKFAERYLAIDTITGKVIFSLGAAGLSFLLYKKYFEKQPTMLPSFNKSSCPLPTQDDLLNSKNRQNAKDNFTYGPLNENPVSFWNRLAKKWKVSVPKARTRRCGNCTAFDISPGMKKCMNTTSNKVGYCWMHKFKCSAARSCATWAPNGPIRTDEESSKWQK